MRYKIAGERVLSIYLFVIYIIVAVGIVSGVIMVYGSPLDVQEKEAGILSDKIIGCLVEQGQLKEGILEGDVDLLEFCKFDFRDNTKKYNGEERYAVKVELYDFESGELKEQLPIVGNKRFLEFCDLKRDNLPKCSEKEIYVLEGQTKYLLKINSAVSKV